MGVDKMISCHDLPNSKWFKTIVKSKVIFQRDDVFLLFQQSPHKHSKSKVKDVTVAIEVHAIAMFEFNCYRSKSCSNSKD